MVGRGKRKDKDSFRNKRSVITNIINVVIQKILIIVPEFRERIYWAETKYSNILSKELITILAK